jgi:hypothetical protein
MSYKRISPIPVIEGGTQVKTWTTAYGLLCGGTTVTAPIQTLASLGATGTILTSQGAGSLPTWTTAVYPATTTTNQLLWSNGANNVVGLTTANSGVLITSAGGVPSISQTLPSAVQTNITAVGALAAGSLTTGFTPVPLAIGGTNAALTASNGGIFYSSATAGAILAGTATAQQIVMSQASTAPIWSTAAYPVSTTINQILYSSSNNVIAGISTANNSVLATNGSGVPAFTTSLPTAVQVAVGSLNSGTSASSSTFWRGDGTWAATALGSGRLLSFQIFTTGTAQTYTKNASATSILVECIGGGSGGGGINVTSTTNSAGGGGGSGGYCRKYITSAASTYTYTVGAGGAGGAAGVNNGSPGTATTFSTLSAGGATGGSASAAITTGPAGIPGVGGSSSGGDINLSGQTGMQGFAFIGCGAPGNGGQSVLVGSGIGVMSASSSNAGVNAGTNSGSGGSGASGNAVNANQAGGNGGAGLIIVWEFS